MVRPPPPPPPPPPPIQPAPAGAKNLLVIVCDDFRPFIAPWTHRYGIKAPNLEKLASESMVFNNTYVQQAVCGPSRNSFMTGKRPDSTNVWTFKTNFRASGMDTTGSPGAEWITFPEMFKLHGWNVLGMGKVCQLTQAHRFLRVMVGYAAVAFTARFGVLCRTDLSSRQPARQ